jgi:hypothetical protein
VQWPALGDGDTMEDARYKVVATQATDPRCMNLLSGVAIEGEDPRYKRLQDRAVLEIEDPRCSHTSVRMEDPRCQNLRIAW